METLSIRNLHDDALKLVLSFLNLSDAMIAARTCIWLNKRAKYITINYTELLYIGKAIKIKHCHLDAWGIGLIMKTDKSDPKQIKVYILHENIKVWIDVSLDYEHEWKWLK